MNRRLVVGAAVGILLAAQGGCAARRPAVSPELREARVEIERARASPLAGRALDDLRDADLAMARAEREARESGVQNATARDSAYVAGRMAEKARLAGLYAAEVEAFDSAARSVDQLRTNLPRKFAADEERARIANAITPRAEFLMELARAGADLGEVLTLDEDTTLLLANGSQLFAPGSSAFLPFAEPRLRALAQVIRHGPPHTVRVQVMDELAGWHADPWDVSAARVARLRRMLIAGGVAPESIDPSTKGALGRTEVEFPLADKRDAGASPRTKRR